MINIDVRKLNETQSLMTQQVFELNNMISQQSNDMAPVQKMGYKIV